MPARGRPRSRWGRPAGASELTIVSTSQSHGSLESCGAAPVCAGIADAVARHQNAVCDEQFARSYVLALSREDRAVGGRGARAGCARAAATGRDFLYDDVKTNPAFSVR